MATDYKKIKPIINLRSIRQSSDKTHFIYELIQNAYDSKSRHLKLHLHENELLVWNDGDQFSQEDVHRICSIGFSAKDLTQVGHYGIGFKAVYNYTDRPEVYSGDERFCIPDPTSTRKTLEDLASSSLIEGIDEVPPRIAEHINKGRTVFRLPFRDSLSQEDITLLKNQLRDLDKRILLFLQDFKHEDFKHELKSIQWRDERDGEIGSYSCCYSPHDKIQNASEVELTILLNGKNQLSETFLVFRKEVQPRQDVIDKLLQQAQDGEEQQRIQKSAEKKQPVEVAFKLHEDKIIETDNSVLFAYLPTEKETHLRFLIQARYQTTPPRDNIVKSSDSPWNEWLVQETADFLPEILEQLKVGRLLEPAFFNVLPLKNEVENEFKPIAEAAKKAMREKLLVPTEDDGYAKAENVFYPHHGSLRKLVESSWLYPNSSWLHTDIGRSGRAFDIMKEAGVKEINVSHVLNWLEKQDLNWFENRCEKWLCSLYIYLNNQKSQLERINGLERIKKLPLIRLENEQCVCASDQLVFFPPDTDEAREEIRPFLNELPIVQLSLLEGDESSSVEGFLKDLEVQTLCPEEMIGKWIIPQYAQFNKPAVEVARNYQHMRYLFKVWDKLSGYQHRNLREEIRKTPILRAYNGIQPEIYDFVKPCESYLPQTYTRDADLETYFSVDDGDIWFVDDAYLEDKSDAKVWFQFLKAIGSMNTPRVNKKEVVGNYEECEKRGITRKRSTRRFKDGSFIYNYYSGYFDGAIEDYEFAGPLEVFNQISDHKKINLSRSLWNLLIKAIEPLSSEKKSRWPWTSSRDAFFQCTYHRFYRDPLREFFDATFYRQLKGTPWLLDEKDNLQVPANCFAPTDDNRRVLGDSVAYLHPDFDVSQDNATAQWLAEKLGIHLNANTASVLNYLQTLSGTEASVEKVEPLYRFLARQDARPREEFKQKSLIFTANPEPRWWKADEVFWKNESPVFGNHRGYLKGNYAAYEGTLKPFFNALGVLDQASQLDYARGIQEITTTEQAKEEEVRSRVRRLYRSLTWLQADQWKIIYDSRCWLGKKGSEWEFFSRNELVWDDHRYIADIFEGEVPFWTFDDLLELTKYLKIEGCSQAKVKFHPEGEKEKDTDLSMMVRNLRPYIHAFLNSPRLCEAPAEGKSADVLNSLSVCFVEELKTTYTLKEISLTSPNPRPSFLEVTNEEVTLWLALAADKDDYALLIGDALQDYFGVKDLGRFTEHLLTKKDRDKVLDNWKREGLRTELCVSLPQTDAKEGEKKRSEYIDQGLPDGADAEIPITNKTPEIGDEDNDLVTDKSEIHPASDEGNDSRTDEPEIETPTDGETTDIDKSNDSSTANEPESPTNPVSDIQGISSRNTQSLTKADSDVTQSVKGEPESETPTVHEDPETGNKNDDSTENKSETTSYQPRPGGSRTRPRGRKGINTPSGNRGTSHSSGRSDGTEDNTHMEETGTSPQARKEIERIGMEHARRYEEEQGYTVEDVSTENLGYDLRSTTPNGEIRCIEVKARTERGLVVLTSNEWHTAEQLKDDYFLYVVLNARTQPEFYIIRNPTNVVSPIQDIRYQVPLSEITEHGIRV